MKIFIPRNISGGRFSMNVTMGPLTLSLRQLIIVAFGLGLTLALRNTLVKGGTSQGVAALISLPIFLLCVFIAFFKYSELTLLPFVAKLIRTYFLDSTKKYQTNWSKIDPKDVAILKSRHIKHDIVIMHKDLTIDEKQLQKLKVISK